MRKELIPQIPDYFGFLLGFLFIWLIYTGFGAVQGVFLNTRKSAVELTDRATKEISIQTKDIMKSNSTLVAQAKDKVEELQLKLESSTRARLAEPKVASEVKKNKTWSSEQLDKANTFINEVIATIGESIYGAPEEEIVSSVPNTPSPIKEVNKKDDSFEWFH